jgi:hypothetical protein
MIRLSLLAEKNNVLLLIKNKEHAVFSLQILIGGDFRIIDREKIWPRVRRHPVGSV